MEASSNWNVLIPPWRCVYKQTPHIPRVSTEVYQRGYESSYTQRSESRTVSTNFWKTRLHNIWRILLIQKSLPGCSKHQLIQRLRLRRLPSMCDKWGHFLHTFRRSAVLTPKDSLPQAVQGVSKFNLHSTSTKLIHVVEFNLTSYCYVR